MKCMKTIALLVGLLLSGCGGATPEEAPSCCLYECEGPRTQWFSMYFGSEAECLQLSTSRCASEYPDAPGLKRYEYVPDVVQDEMTELNQVCADKVPAFEAVGP